MGEPSGCRPSVLGHGEEWTEYELTFDAISVQRLEDASAVVAEALGRGAPLVERRVAPLEDTGAQPAQPDAPAADDDDPTVPADIRDAVVAGFVRARFQRILDELDPRLEGLTPREAARSPRHRPAVERWLRTLENTAAHGAAAEGMAPELRSDGADQARGVGRGDRALVPLPT